MVVVFRTESFREGWVLLTPASMYLMKLARADVYSIACTRLSGASFLSLLLKLLLSSSLIMHPCEIVRRHHTQAVYATVIDDHFKEETKLRQKKYKMETERDNWVAKYDKVW